MLHSVTVRKTCRMKGLGTNRGRAFGGADDINLPASAPAPAVLYFQLSLSDQDALQIRERESSPFLIKCTLLYTRIEG